MNDLIEENKRLTNEITKLNNEILAKLTDDYFTEDDFKQFCALFDKAYTVVTKEYNKLSHDFINKRTKKDRLYRSGVDDIRETPEYYSYKEAHEKRQDFAKIYNEFKHFSNTLELMK